MEKFYCNKCNKVVILKNGICPNCKTNWKDYINEYEGKKSSSKFNYKSLIVVLIIIILGVITTLYINKKNSEAKNSIITVGKEYWVADNDIIGYDSKKRYSYKPGTNLYAFYDNNKCEILTLNLNKFIDGFSVKKYKIYGELKGAWVSFKTSKCTYEKTKDTIIIKKESNYEDDEFIETPGIKKLVANYNKMDDNTLLITWTNSNLKKESYKKIIFSEYIDDCYIYSGDIMESYYNEEQIIDIISHKRSRSFNDIKVKRIARYSNDSIVASMGQPKPYYEYYLLHKFENLVDYKNFIYESNIKDYGIMDINNFYEENENKGTCVSTDCY